MTIWETLKINPTQDKKQIKKAYAEQLTQYHPEEYPEAFQTIQNAYQDALRYADTIQTEDELVEENDLEIPETILDSTENQSDDTTFEALNAYLDYVIDLCKASDPFALTQLVNDPQFKEVGFNAYFMNQLRIHLSLNYQDIQMKNIEALQQIYGYRAFFEERNSLSESQCQLVMSLKLLERFHHSQETNFYHFCEKVTKSEPGSSLKYLQGVAKNKSLYTLVNTSIFKKLDNYKISYTTAFIPLMQLIDEKNFTLYCETETVLTWISNVLFRTSRLGFVLATNDADYLATKLKLNDISDSDPLKNVKLITTRALEVSQKKTIRKKLAYRKLKKSYQASL